MSNTTQAEILQKVLEIEKTIKQTKLRLGNLRTESYDEAPIAPTRNLVNRTYPEIVPTVEFDKKKAFLPLIVSIVATVVLSWVPVLGLVITFTFWPALIWSIYSYFVLFKKEKTENIEQIRNSEEYKEKCADCDKAFDEQQAEFDKAYEEAKTEYDTKILPDYEIKLAEWTAKHDKEVEEQEVILKNAETELENLYTTTKIVPIQYRNIEALQYITDMVSSSDYDVKQAIESYDKKVQRDLDIKKIEEQQIANQLADEQANLLAEQADLIEESNKIARKARRDANISSAIGIVQRHNLNKKFK